MSKNARSGGKRKIGRNRAKCARYAARHMRTVNNPARKRRPNERTPH